MKRFYLAILMSFTSSILCAQDLLLQNFAKFELPAVRVTGQYITPSDGVDILTARKLIFQYLVEREIKGDFEKRLQVEEITVDQAWKVNKMQLYSVKLDYAWLDGVAVISEDHVVDILSGMHITSVYLADVNFDQKYEICINNEVGSGIIDSRIMVLDVQNHKTYSLSERGRIDFYLNINEKKELVVYSASWFEKHKQKEYLGKLKLEGERLAITN